MIPRTIHQIWLGPGEPPDAIETWRAAHPDWEHRLWTDADIRVPLVNQVQFEAMDELCGKADILRYELLHRHGGVYLDADLECLRPLPESLLTDPCFTAYESEDYRPGLVANGVIGAEPGHPVLSAMLITVGQLDPDELGGEMAVWTSGTYPFTRVVHANAGTVRIHPSGLFYPDHYEGPGRDDVRAVGRHDWFYGRPTVCLAAVLEGTGDDLSAELRAMRPHINRYVVAVIDDDPQTAAATEVALADVPGAVLSRPGSAREVVWPEVLGAAARVADFVVLGCVPGFTRRAMRPEVDGYVAGGEVRVVRAQADWAVTGAAGGLPRLSVHDARVEELP